MTDVGSRKLDTLGCDATNFEGAYGARDALTLHDVQEVHEMHDVQVNCNMYPSVP